MNRNSFPTTREAVETQLFGIIKFGLSGYLVGRSLEKNVKSYSKGKRKPAEKDAVDQGKR